MSDDQSQVSTPPANYPTIDVGQFSVDKDVTPKKKNIFARIFQSQGSKAALAVFAFLIVGVGGVAVQKVQNNKSRASASGIPHCQQLCDYGRKGCLADAQNTWHGLHQSTHWDGVSSNELRYCNAERDNCYAGCATGRSPSGSTDYAAQAAAARAAEEARVRAEWQRAYAYALEVKKQQEYRDAAAYARACQAAQSIKPTLTWLSSQGGRSFILPGEKKIKFQVGAGQDGAIIFIDDKATPWSGSCNDLKTGDQCLVPDGKGVNKHADGTRITKEQVGAAGKTQTTYSGFEDGHSYRVWLKGASCGKLSPDSNKLDITIAANDLSGTPAVSTTPAVTPTGTNTQQQGHL